MKTTEELVEALDLIALLHAVLMGRTGAGIRRRKTITVVEEAR